MAVNTLRQEIKNDVKKTYIKNYIPVLIVTLFLVGAYYVIDQTPGMFVALKWLFLFTIFAPIFFVGLIKFLSNVYFHKMDLNDLLWSFKTKERYFQSLIFLGLFSLLVITGLCLTIAVTGIFNYLEVAIGLDSGISLILNFTINALLVIYIYVTFAPFPFFFILEEKQPIEALKNGFRKMHGKRIDFIMFNLSFIGWLVVVIIVMLLFASLLGITFYFQVPFLYMLSITIFTYVSKIAVASFIYYYFACLTGYFIKYLEI